MKTIFILAGNRQEYDYFLHFEAEDRENLQHVYVGTSPRRILGFNAIDAYILGTFWNRKDSKEVFDMVSRIINKKPHPFFEGDFSFINDIVSRSQWNGKVLLDTLQAIQHKIEI